MSKNKKEFKIPKSPFIDYLEELKRQENMGALASLRRGLQYDLGHCVDMYPYIIPWLEHVQGKWEKEMYYLIASLFAYHPRNCDSGNMGDVFRNISRSKRETKSLEQRFVALLRSNPEDLPFHMRQAISIAKSENIPINWHELFYDLKRWPFAKKYPPYEKWAGSFWKREQKNENNE